MDRKAFLRAAAAGLFGAPFLANAACAEPQAQAKQAAIPPLKKTKKEWKKLLDREQYAVLFEEDTEYPGSSPLNKEKRKGTFICAACFLPLFDSSKKYESGTGWPSFFDAIPGRVGTKTDFKLLYPRKEYHCARCGGPASSLGAGCPPPRAQCYCVRG
jgi:peptide-methionine (R)-S-oxide reductase